MRARTGRVKQRSRECGAPARGSPTLTGPNDAPFGAPAPRACPLLTPLVESLRAERIRQGINAEVLAERIGLSEKQVTKWERHIRRPTAFLLAMWAEALGLSILAAPTSTAPAALRDAMADASRRWRSGTATPSWHFLSAPVRSPACNDNQAGTFPSSAPTGFGAT